MGPLCMYARQCPLTLKHHTGGLFFFQVSENPSNRNAPFLYSIILKNQTFVNWHSSNQLRGGEDVDSYSLEQITDEAIIDELMGDYGQDILHLVLQYVHDFSLAEDLTQEIFLKCFKALPTFQYQ